MLLSTMLLSLSQKSLFAILVNNFMVIMHSLFIADVCNPITMVIVETIKTIFFFCELVVTLPLERHFEVIKFKH